MAEKSSQEKLFSYLLSLIPIIEIEKIEEGAKTSMRRKEYIKINGNKINFYNFKVHLDTIQKRNYLNRFCLYEISKDCDNRNNITKKEIKLLDKEKNNYLPNFLIQCEYFLFSTKTIFDTILKMIGYIFPEESQPTSFRGMENWTNEIKIKSLISTNWNWFIKFNELRNSLTHDAIAGITTQIKSKPQEGIINYSKRNLKIWNEKKQKEDVLQLPNYFEECFSKTNQFINSFYELLIKQKIEGAPIS